jgi:hypothetical protein
MARARNEPERATDARGDNVASLDRRAAERDGDAARDATERAMGTATQVSRDAAQVAEKLTDRSAKDVQQLAALPSWALAELFRAEAAFPASGSSWQAAR